MSPQQIMDFFEGYGLHISDGCDPCLGWDDQAMKDASEELSALIADVETDRKGVPVLLKQYLKLGGELVAFNIDRRFSDALDGLIVVDLRKTDARVLERYMGKAGAAQFLTS